tara:strand:- start:1006 stop:1308 length:303 start_codon:yes stop_codon:yes gene_type:complete
MPTYTFKNNKTGETFDKVMKIAEKEPYLKDNPDLSPVLNATNFVGDHIVKKMDGGMKETLQKIADKNPNTPLADRFSRRSAKDIKREKVVKKYNLKDTLV